MKSLTATLKLKWLWKVKYRLNQLQKKKNVMRFTSINSPKLTPTASCNKTMGMLFSVQFLKCQGSLWNCAKGKLDHKSATGLNVKMFPVPVPLLGPIVGTHCNFFFYWVSLFACKTNRKNNLRDALKSKPKHSWNFTGRCSCTLRAHSLTILTVLDIDLLVLLLEEKMCHLHPLQPQQTIIITHPR